MVIQGICLSGGGSKGIAHLGALHKHWSEGFLSHENIKAYSGSSVGAYICLLLSIGYLPIEIFTEIYNLDSFFEKIGELNDPLNFFKNYHQNFGIFSPDKLVSKVEKMVKNKLGKVPTLLELFEITGKKFVVSVGNETKIITEYLSKDTYPELDCVMAAKMSSNIPGIFPKIKYKDCYYVDGGIGDNLPISCIDDGNIEILAILLRGGLSKANDENYINYMWKSQQISIISNEYFRIKNCKNNVHVMCIKLQNSLFVEPSISKERKMEMFMAGQASAELCFSDLILFE